MERTIQAVNGIELAVTEAGMGDPVVLIHGFPELAYSWRYQLPSLSGAGFRAIAYDQRGYGGSSKPDTVEAYALTSLVADAIGLLDALNIERATFVGHDWGSIVVWSAALMHPNRVEKVVSLNVPYRGWCAGFPTTEFIREHLADRFGYVLSFQAPGVTEAAFESDPDAWLRTIFMSIAADKGFMGDNDFAVFRDAFVDGGIFGPLGPYRNIDANAAATEHLANAPITQPTLMITADRDPILPPSLADGMERWIPDLTVAGIEHSGHWTQQEQPDQVNAALIGFLREGTNAL
ncbi:MAG: alpha/beta hydrolase [Actinomycetota bacterium]|nr:alpha/beta hydrolase [Actinomycetota bacterium]